MSDVWLTASMQDTLLSLRDTNSKLGHTSNVLSSGLEVNSALDDPSSYYTASSLSNRAKDLNILLDSMGEAIKSVVATNQALEAASTFIEHASSTTNSAIENLEEKTVVDEQWLIDNGVKVSDIAHDRTELSNKLASASSGDTIVVLGNIDMSDSQITVQDGVNLVGAGYYVESLGLENTHTAKGLSSISFSQNTDIRSIVLESNSTLSDLEINATADVPSSAQGVIYANSATNVTLKDLSIEFSHNAINTDLTGSEFVGAIYARTNSEINIEGKIDIKTDGFRSVGFNMPTWTGTPTLSQDIDSIINIETSGGQAYGFTYGIYELDGMVNVKTKGTMGSVFNDVDSGSYVSGNLEFEAEGESPLFLAYGGEVRFAADANVMMKGDARLVGKTTSRAPTFETGSVIGIYNDSSNTYDVYENLNNIRITDTNFDIAASADFINSSYSYDEFTKDNEDKLKTLYNDKDYFVGQNYKNQYNEILNQFDSLVQDADYLGVNLLKGDDISVTFNEDRTSVLEVRGVNASTTDLGLNQSEWEYIDDIKSSQEEINKVVDKLRDFTSYFGNKYSIISNRQDFTENLIDVLTEGANKLVQADLTEESANMLALQTRQSLGIESLSLASQSSQAVLQLF